ncbi:MAG: ATP-binding protein [Gemmatimonadota bacterium]
MRLRTSLILTVVGAVALALALLTWQALAQLQGQVEQQARGDLVREARLAATALRGHELNDALADSLGVSSGRRVTFIGRDGTVLGDSNVDADRLGELENHASRPEVRAALAGGDGIATRASSTVSRNLLYAASPHPDGAVRLALQLGEIEQRIERVRQVLVLGALLALAAAAALAALLSRRLLGPLRHTEAAARAVLEGDHTRRVRARPGSDTISRLGQAIDEMADRLETSRRRVSQDETDLDAIFETLREGIAVVATDRTVTRSNRVFDEFVGRTAAGHRLAGLTRDPGVDQTLDEALRGNPASHETESQGRIYSIRARPHEDGALLLIRDVTDLRRLEGVRRDFVANVSHELKTPLTGISGYAEALAEPDVPPDQAHTFVQKIRDNASRMRLLIEDLLALARVESRPDLDRKSLLLSPVLDRVWSGLERSAADRGVTLARAGASDATVTADERSLEQILSNLLDNAVRYSPDGGVVTLRVEAQPDEGATLISVHDTGPGVPKPLQERVFERFYRVDPARDRASGGTGLGLSIVKHLVLAHGGRLGLDSELGRGATFWFSLPSASV